jgi:ribosomal protein S18 acetylase RimI-like enzyme
VRAGGGFTGRANSVLPLGEPDRDLPAALAAVASWYTERGLPARFQVPLRARAALDRDLAEAGFAIDNPSRVLVAPIAALTGAGTPGTVDLAATPDDSWLAAYTYRGGTLPDVGPAVLTACDGDVSFATLKDDEGVVAIGRGAACAGWLGLTAVEVAPRARRRGHAVTVCRALGAWAQERGARQVYLQVADGNTAALALYAGLGLRHHHRYHYRVRRDGDQR